MEKKENLLVVTNTKKNILIKNFLVDAYDDKICKLANKKQKVDYEQYKMGNIQDSIKENPLFEHYIAKMMLYKIKINNLNNEIKNLEQEKDGNIDSVKRIYDINEVEIPKLNLKIASHRKPFYRFIEREDVDINENDIDELVCKDIKYFLDDEVNVNETISMGMLKNNIILDKNEEEIIKLTNKVLSLKNVRWYQFVKKSQMREEYNILKK